MSVLADNRLFNVFQHTAARRRLDPSHTNRCRQNYVSTHSRPKAAGHAQTAKPADNRGFNTRPPEGGWKTNTRSSRQRKCFNTQPPEGGWLCENIAYNKTYRVSTHSRPKAAGISAWIKWTDDFCFNTQPPEGGWVGILTGHAMDTVFQHTAARRRLDKQYIRQRQYHQKFQHTAARRRLATIGN